MNFRRAVLAVLVLLVTVAVWWFNRPVPRSQAQTQVQGDVKAPSAPGSKSAENIPTPATRPNAMPPTGLSQPGAPSAEPAPAPPVRTVYMPPEPAPPEAFNDLQNTSRMLTDYRQIMGENPVGTNAEIMKSLMGGNKKGAMLGPPEGMQLNSNGELVDRWGTAIFFHALAKDRMEIRSAGPDHVMWTNDDVVLK